MDLLKKYNNTSVIFNKLNSFKQGKILFFIDDPDILKELFNSLDSLGYFWVSGRKLTGSLGQCLISDLCDNKIKNNRIILHFTNLQSGTKTIHYCGHREVCLECSLTTGYNSCIGKIKKNVINITLSDAKMFKNLAGEKECEQ